MDSFFQKLKNIKSLFGNIEFHENSIEDYLRIHCFKRNTKKTFVSFIKIGEEEFYICQSNEDFYPQQSYEITSNLTIKALSLKEEIENFIFTGKKNESFYLYKSLFLSLKKENLSDKEVYNEIKKTIKSLYSIQKEITRLIDNLKSY